jgi:hypothetical protein
LYPRQAEVLPPSKSGRQPAARCSAVTLVAPEVEFAVVSGTLFWTGAQPATTSAS